MNSKTGLNCMGLGIVAVLAAALTVTGSVGAQDIPGFDGYIQSGTCAAPTDDVLIELEDDRSDYAVEPYIAKIEGGGTVTLAYYGAPEAPGFGFSTGFTDEEVFSLVISDADTGAPVACGDILEPDDENFEEIGVALVRLLPAGDSGLEGYAIVERTETQRELVVVPTRVRILLTTSAEVTAPAAGTPEATPTT
jgi:hypothetical protein